MTRTTPEPFRGLGDESGSSLVEILVAFLLLTVAIGALASTLAFSARSIGDSRSRQLSTSAFQAASEAARLLSFDTLAMDAAASPPATFDPDGPGPLGPEPTIAVAGGAVAGEPFQVTGNGVVVETWITEPADSKGRRLSVVTTWNRPGSGPTTSYFGTVLVEASRGLALSAFDVSPAELSGFSPTGRTICTPRTITNAGDDDNYDVVRPEVVGSPSIAQYAFSAYLDLDLDGVADAAEFLNDVTGDANPDTASLGDDGRVGAGETLHLLLCYDPIVSPGSQDSLDVRTRVRSSSDPNVAVEVRDLVAVGDSLELDLHDMDNTQAHDRVLAEAFEMGVEPATTSTLFDYDANIDPADRPGLFMQRGQASHAGVWEFQATTDLVLDEALDLELWLASSEALAVSAPAAPSPMSLELDVTIAVRSGTDVTTVGTGTVGWVHTQAGFLVQSTVLSIGDGGAYGVDLAAGHYLRLELACSRATETDCHVAYHTTATPSRLTVGVA